jgi:PAS domain S-box-containing protein
MAPHKAGSSRATAAAARKVRAEYLVLEASPNAVVGIDQRGAISYANPQVEATFGYVPDEVLGKPIELLLPEPAGTRQVGHGNRFMAHPIARPMGTVLDLAGRRKDGTEFPVEISLSPVETADGLQVFATVVDVTARKRAEAALADSERRFRAVLEASSNAVVAIDARGAISYVNPQVGTTFGYEREEMLGQPMELLLPERATTRHVAHRDGFLAHPVARPMGISLDLAGRRKDGTEFPVEISLSPVETADGLQVFATVVDITARKAAEAALLQSQKLESVGRLAGGIAHDFNNMLFAIRGYAELLAEDLLAGNDRPLDLAESQRNVQAIGEAAERATGLTAQLLAFSRQQVISPTVVDLNAAIDGLEPMVRRLIGENQRLVLKLDSTAGNVLADAGQLDQILVNLVVNARDSMPDGGTVTIETGNVEFVEPYAIEHFDVRPGRYVLVSVSDTGVGMDRETRAHIFEPFFTTKDLGKGTGLGLATIYGIVTQSGGHIWLYSELGRGSSFKIYFPRVDAGVTSERPPIAEAQVIGDGTVLVVEDESLVRTMTSKVLTRAGYRVIGVADGAQAMARIAELQDSIDVLVTDVIMPNMSGIEVAEGVMARHPNVAVVLLSGYTAETLDLERVTSRGATFVSKPVTSAQLLAAVRQALAERRASARSGPSE